MYQIVVLPGDGIGPEIVAPAVAVLQAAAKRFGFKVQTSEALIGGCAIDQAGTPLPQQTIDACRKADAVLLGAVGGPKWDGRTDGLRPEQGLLGIREALKLFANLRPAVVYPALRGASPLREEILGERLDLLVVRELTGGIYFGERGRKTINGAPAAYDTELYTQPEIERIAHVAFRLAAQRSGRLCSVDKANVLESSRLWRSVVSETAHAYPGVQLSHMYVDNAAMQLVRDPQQFDVLVTGNMFGDILSDEASQITGSIGMLPSASLGENGPGLYEPIHGSAPDIAGRDLANPIATILSVAMLLRHSLKEVEAANAVEAAVAGVIDKGYRTVDLAAGTGAPVGTKEMGGLVLQELESI